jgi:hypothetical protein
MSPGGSRVRILPPLNQLFLIGMIKHKSSARVHFIS